MLLLGVLASIDPLRPAVFALVLSTRRSNALAFLFGWAAALALLFGLAYVALGGDASKSLDSAQRTAASVIVLIIGVALLVVAVRHWLRRDENVERHVVPDGLVRRLDGLDLQRAGVLGVLIQPRSLTIAAALVCARDRTDAFDLLIGFALFAAASTCALIGLLIYDLLQPAEAQHRLTEIIALIEREGPWLVTVGAAIAGLYLTVNSLLDLVSS